MAINFELENMDIRPEQEPLLLEMIHAVKKLPNLLSTCYNHFTLRNLCRQLTETIRWACRKCAPQRT